MIGTCDACGANNVPVARFEACAAHPEAMTCFIYQGEDDPDPYGETDNSASDRKIIC